VSARRAALLPVCLLLAACGSSTPAQPVFDTSAMLGELTGNVMLPTLGSMRDAGSELEEAVSALADGPSQQRLSAAQAAWRAARKPWRQADAFRFGPAVDDEIALDVDWWPTSPDNIEEAIASGDAIDDAYVSLLGVSAKGYMALEYLLFDAELGDQAILDALEGDPRRGAFAAALAANVASRVSDLQGAWDPEDGDYAGELAGAGKGSGVYPTEQEAIDELVNQLVIQVENVADEKIGAPFGKKSGGEVLPEAEESRRSDNSLEDMLDTLRGMQAIWTGDHEGAAGKGLEDLVKSRNAKVAARTTDAFAIASASVRAIPPPFRVAITDSPDEVDKAWADVKELKIALATEVVGALGVTLRFNPNDGD
jgi:uncharacterized protein